MRDPKGFLRDEYERLVRNGLDWKPNILEGSSGPRCIIAGKDVIMLCSNNYLNLSNHPKLKEAAKRAIETYGVGSGAARSIAGTMDLHIELEEKIAEFKHKEAALFYPTGYAVNSGLVPQLAGKGDLIISDELNHGSIVDGVRLSQADRAIFKHCDVKILEQILDQAEKKNYGRILVITDGVFSMDGDIAPLDEIVKLAEQHGAMTYVDDAHGGGVLGDKGRGIGSHFHLEDEIDIEMGTFSKAFGVLGGYICGSTDLINFALNKSRTWLLATSPPPQVVAACIAAIEVLETEPQHLEKLWKNTNYLKKSLRELGFNTLKSQTPLTPVVVGESNIARKLSSRLLEEGIFAGPAIVFPMVARGNARIRTIMNAGLEMEDLDFTIDAFEKIGKELKII